MKTNSARMLSKRTQLVWASFFIVIPCVLFILQLGDGEIQGGVLLTKLAPVEERPEVDVILDAVQGQSWDAIVIQHLAKPAGIVESIDRDHKNTGLNGLGYHFLIGNGNGLDDGHIHVGYRWLNQTSAARPTDINESNWGSRTVSICLVGNGNRRPFTSQQLVHLCNLVQRLQIELSIPANRVWLAHELGEKNSSPGKHFAEAQFKSQLLDIPLP